MSLYSRKPAFADPGHPAKSPATQYGNPTTRRILNHTTAEILSQEADKADTGKALGLHEQMSNTLREASVIAITCTCHCTHTYMPCNLWCTCLCNACIHLCSSNMCIDMCIYAPCKNTNAHMHYMCTFTTEYTCTAHVSMLYMQTYGLP